MLNYADANIPECKYSTLPLNHVQQTVGLLLHFVTGCIDVTTVVPLLSHSRSSVRMGVLLYLN